ncbi:MAG: ankyrin repeat domain-containing protein [Micavibrio sp.]|nr:ankyrin repeat domain-containing protein [Micavibrio sp.]
MTAKAAVFLPPKGIGQDRANLTADEKIAFFSDCELGNIDAIEETLKRCPQAVAFADDVGQTPLHLAAAWAKTEAVELLMQSGAPLHVQDKNGQSAADLANRLGYESISRMIANEHDGREIRANNAAAAAQKEAALRDVAMFTQGLPAAIMTRGRPVRFKN